MDNDFLLYDEEDDYNDLDLEMYEDEVWENETSFEMPEMTLGELWESCMYPTLKETMPLIGKLLVYCLIFRITNALVILPGSVVHLTSVSIGLLALYLFAYQGLGYIIGLCLFGYVSLFFGFKIMKRCGVISALSIVLFLIVCEVFVVEKKEWHAIRGIQMMLSLKIISLGFDLDSGAIPHFPSFLEINGYCLCVGNLIFGPWTSYKEYIKMIHKNTFSLQWILKLISSSLFAIVFLILSTCLCNWIITDDSNKWFLAYRDALSFRSSHYFVSFISEVTAACVGYEVETSGWDAKKVSQPQYIEFPRSLTEVVIYWNKPMHFWLKTYVFKNFQSINTFVAIFATYAASSLLHGLNFQLAAVLLSLGFYTYIEYSFRKKLANIFSACVLARKCPNYCPHVNKWNKPTVILTNLVFGCISVFHLSYLGVMFNSSTQEQDHGYSMKHTLSKWSELNFSSHWLTFGMYVVHWLI